MPFEQRVALAGSHRDPIAGAKSARPADKNELVHATVILRRRSQSRLPDAPEEFAFSDPETISHHSREEFGQVHGASSADIAVVEAFAHAFDLTVSERSPERRSVVLTGTAENMQRAFGTSLTHYDSPEGPYRGRTGPVSLPTELAPLVTAVLGLDNRPIAKPHVRMARAAAPAGSLSPVQVAAAYGFPTTVNGSGQTIGIIELGGGFRSSDLNTYFQSLHLKAPTVLAVSVDGGANKPGADPNSDGEVMLDIEVSGAVAPGARIVVYFAPNTDQGFVDAITTAVHDQVNKPSVISISWGGPEDNWTLQARNAMLAAVTDAAAVGVTVTAAAGDDGATDGVSDNKLHVDLPACLPPVLACGGTKLVVSHGAIQSESVWNELANQEGATGGGVSKLFALPSYQSAAKVPVQPETNFAGRGVPDVAGDADPVTGYQVRVDGKNSVIGGTSAVAPLWAGLVALFNQQIGRPMGFINPLLYQVGTPAFHDVTSGNNGHYQAASGWDPCTGWGTPNGAALISAITGKATKAARPVT